MCLRKKLDEESIKSKFEKSSNTLDEILSVQRPSSDKFGLVYDKEKKPKYSSFINQDERSYDVALKKEESNKSATLLHRKYLFPKRPVTSKHQQLFLGNCYTYNSFGHMDRKCKLVIHMDGASKYQGKEEGIAWKKKDDVECSLALCATEKKKSMAYG